MKKRPEQVIVILDNGADYSAHEILFVECPLELVPHVETCWLGMPRDCFYNTTVVAVVDEIEWRAGRPLSLKELLDRFDLYFEDAEDAYLHLLENVPPRRRRRKVTKV